ncbi:MAG: hypothetical protein M3N54_04970, partial [Acidobacteriota bacterium]|nr:hypothetical protein [Acidobacteriota bacterium]
EDYSVARLSGGLLDMLAAKHIPVFAVPASQTGADVLKKAQVAVNYDPVSSPALQAFSTLGKTVIDGPRAPAKTPQSVDDFIFDPNDSTVNTIWQKVSAAVGRQNMGARLFNVSSMLSNLVALRGARQLVLHLVNYSEYPASGITARVVGNYRRARLYRPGEAPVDLDVEKIEDGTGFAIDQRIVTIATVVLE